MTSRPDQTKSVGANLIGYLTSKSAFSCHIELYNSEVRVRCFRVKSFMRSSFLLFLRPVLDRQTTNKRAKRRALTKREAAQPAIERFIILDAERHRPCLRGLVTIPRDGSPSPVSPNDKESNALCLPRGYSMSMLFVVLDVNVNLEQCIAGSDNGLVFMMATTCNI